LVAPRARRSSSSCWIDCCLMGWQFRGVRMNRPVIQQTEPLQRSRDDLQVQSRFDGSEARCELPTLSHQRVTGPGAD
jgi:hypothetical protein